MTRELFWVKDALSRIQGFPREVRVAMGYALFEAQEGKKSRTAKPFKGLGSGVLEVAEHFDGDTYRAVYTVRLKKGVYVLHAFQKKAKKGVKTPKQEVDLIRQRLKDAIAMDEEN